MTNSSLVSFLEKIQSLNSIELIEIIESIEGQAADNPKEVNWAINEESEALECYIENCLGRKL